ncbi:MAG TPA: cation diffusion facilitator family transporter [Bacillota bacterium]
MPGAKPTDAIDQQTRAARAAVAVSALLTAVQLAAGLATASLSILSHALDAALDLLATAGSLFAVRIAARPPDRDHPFGHGKAQNVAALAQSLLVLATGGGIALAAVTALRGGAGPVQTAPGIAVMASVAGIKLVLAARLRAVARRTDAAALEATAVNLAGDAASAVATLVALGAVRWTGLRAFDALAGLLVAVVILHSGLHLLVQAVHTLMDRRLHDTEEKQVRAALAAHRDRFVEVHDLRTRRAGARRHIDFHLVVHRRQPIGDVHALCDQLEDEIRRRLPDADVLIHPEPCDEDCPQCAGPRGM